MQHEPDREPSAASGPEPSEPTASSARAGLLTEIALLGRAIKSLFGAQLHLVAAELGLARSAVSVMLLAGLAATIVGVGLGLTTLGLIGVALARWFDSWLWALAALILLQVVFLVLAVMLFRRCMHWMSLPGIRSEWRAMMHDTMDRAREQIDDEQIDKEKGEHDR